MKPTKFKAKAKKDTMGKIKHKKTEIDGIVFHSKLEAQYYTKLKQDLEEGKIKDFSLQPEFILQEKFIVVDGEVIYGSNKDFNKLKKQSKAETIRQIKYIGDFLVTDNDGRQTVVDTKGRSTTEFELKKKMFYAKYPMYRLDVLIYDKKADEWVDYYKYNKELRAKKKAKKLEAEAC